MEGEDKEEEGVGSLSVRNFLAARVTEINSLSLEIGSSGVPSSKGLAFQHVPKHMRRRAVSHNVKRLPRRLREIHSSQIEKSGAQSKPKMPSRKHRRRKSNLLHEYNRRQRLNKWLETHIWHAKRFHMLPKWNYMIPVSPTDKGFRALYRAASRDCVIRDISFLSCFQLTGSAELICSKISSSFLPSSCNALCISSVMYTTGSREGTLYFYKKGAYPYGFIGKVRFNWIHKGGESEQHQTLWLWVHPGQKLEILQELLAEFALEDSLLRHVKRDLKITSEFADEELMDVEGSHEPEKASKMSIDEIKLIPKNLHNRPSWENETTGVVLTDLEGVFNRIRLYGPLSTNRLQLMLNVLDPEKLNTMVHESKSSSASWWMDHYSNGNGKEVLRKQMEVWSSLKTFNDVPCNSIIPLTVGDPRVRMPDRRTKEKYEKDDSSAPDKMDVEVTEVNEEEDWDVGLDAFELCAKENPLRLVDIRTQLIKEKMSDGEFSKRRSELLIPGSRIDLGPEENQIPVMLIHRPSTAVSGLQNGGWDLIIPAGWTMQFWVALSYTAARACGVRDAASFEFEAGTVHGNNEDASILPPDSSPGKNDDEEDHERLRTNYYKMTPAKRVNMIKLGCPFPFKISWPQLLRFNAKLQISACSTTDGSEDFYVLRDGAVLEKLQTLVNSKAVREEEISELIAELQNKYHCIVGVRLVTIGKGTVDRGAAICLPTNTDLEFLNSKSSEPNMKSEIQMDADQNEPVVQEDIDEPDVHEGFDLIEPATDDSKSRKIRDLLHKSHRIVLKLLAKKRMKIRAKIDKAEEDNDQELCEELKKYDSTSISKKYNDDMDALWLGNSEEMLEKMTRTPIGFTTWGHESYSIGKQAGFGYCTLEGLQKWLLTTHSLGKMKSIVIYRNCRESWDYRFARLEICQLS